MSGLIAVDGSFHRLRLPVLALGSGPEVDVAIPGTDGLHAIIAPTPAGPALRCFGAVSVNGERVMAAMLKHGDILDIGTQAFTLAWHGHTLEAEVARVLEDLDAREARIVAADRELEQRSKTIAAELAALEARMTEAASDTDELACERADFDEQLKSLEAMKEAFAAERRAFAETVRAVEAEQAAMKAELALAGEQMLAEREAMLAEINETCGRRESLLTEEFAARETKFADELAVFEARRHQFETALAEDRAALVAEAAAWKDTNQQHIENESTSLAELRAAHQQQVEKDSRTLAATVAQLQDHWRALEENQKKADEMIAVAVTMRDETAEKERTLVSEKEQLRIESEGLAAKHAAAWQGINDATTRLAQERQAASIELNRRAAMLENQANELASREAGFHTRHTSAAQELMARNTALEARTREVDQREAIAAEKYALLQRDIAAAELKLANMPSKAEAFDDWKVPLAKPERNMDVVRAQEQELARERQRLQAQLHDAAALREQLEQQKAQVAEQIRGLETERRQWKQHEHHMANEMESLAKSLAEREAELDAKSQVAGVKKAVQEWQQSLMPPVKLLRV